jgi:hypothetical protein
MVEENIASVFSGMFSGTINTIIIIFVGIIVATVSGLIAWSLIRRQRYNIKCVIFSKDGMKNNGSEIWYGGIFLDKKAKHEKFWFRGMKSYTLDPKKIRLIPEREGKKIIYTAYFQKKSETDIQPLEWEFDVNNDIMPHPNGHDANWWLTAKEIWRPRVYGTDWKMYLPLIGMVMTTMLLMIICFVIIQKWELLVQISSNIASAAQSMKETAMTLNGGLPSGTIIK